MSELETKLGALLKVERQRRNLSVADLSNELKIPESYVEAIEQGDMSVLPSPLYYKLFAKSYATYLGIDYTKTVDAIQEDLGLLAEPAEPTPPAGEAPKPQAAPAARPAPAAAPTAPPPEKKSGGILGKALVIGAAIIVVFAAVLLGLKYFTGGERTDAQTAATEEDLTQSPVPESATDSGLTNYQWVESNSTEPDSLRLTLTAKGQSWATIIADGDTAIYQSLTPWRTYTVAAQFRLVVSIGVPGVVDVTLNGEPAYLVDVQTGTISRLEINQANRSDFRQPASQTRPPVPLAEPGGQQDSAVDSVKPIPSGGHTQQQGNH